MDLYHYTYDLVKQIPSGKISSYGAVARALGDIKASRAVGRMMNQNPDPDDMPCFKIVQSDGHLGGFGRGIDDKIRRLTEEGIQVSDDTIVDFEQVFFDNFHTDYPLKHYRQEQINLAQTIDVTQTISEEEVDYVTGFDVAYPFDDDWKQSCGACVTIDYHSSEIVEQHTHVMHTHFPYIPTFLSYREQPFIIGLMKKLRYTPSVLMLDGNGILHPFGFGLACHVGVTLNKPSIGVAKSLLCGTQQEDNTIQYNDTIAGFAFYAHNRVKNPVYISQGNMISLETAISIVKKTSTYKQPKPLRLAHQLATTTLKQGL